MKWGGCAWDQAAGVRATSYLSVDNLVPAKCAGLPEAFAAHFAHKGPGAGVHRHVSGQIIMSVKNLQEKYTIQTCFLRNDVVLIHPF